MDSEHFVNPAWHERTPRLGRRFLRVFVRDLLLLVVLAMVGEGAVRRLLPEYNRLRFTDTVTGGHPKRVNSLGMREGELPQRRPPGETRLLCLGNSTTFGAGVAVEDTYPKQLERLLNASHPDKSYFVINGSGEGGSVDKATAFLKETGLGLEPSVVILGYSASMMALTKRAGSTAGGGQAPGIVSRCSNGLRRAALRLHGRLYSSYAYVFFDTNVRRRLYRLGVLRDRLDKPQGAIFAYAFDDPGVSLERVEEAYRALAENVAEMKALLDERGVPLVVLGIPSRFRISDLGQDNERGFDARRIRIDPMERVAECCRSLEIPFVDMRVRLRAERQAMTNGERPWDDLYIPMDYSHLNETALGMAAEELFQVLSTLIEPGSAS